MGFACCMRRGDDTILLFFYGAKCFYLPSHSSILCTRSHITHLSDASSFIHRDVTPSPSKIATPCMELPIHILSLKWRQSLALSWIHTHKTHTPHTLSIGFSLSLSIRLLYLYEIFVTFPCITFFSPQTTVMPLYPPPPPTLGRSFLPAFFPHHEHFLFPNSKLFHFFFLLINYHHDWLFLGLFEFIFSPNLISVARQEDEKRWRSKNQPWYSKSLLNTSPVVFILS